MAVLSGAFIRLLTGPGCFKQCRRQGRFVADVQQATSSAAPHTSFAIHLQVTVGVSSLGLTASEVSLPSV